MISLHGIGVSRGIAIGCLYLIKRDALIVNERKITSRQINTEIKRLDIAIANTRKQLHAISNSINLGEKVHISPVIDAHLLMLSDEPLTTEPKDIIRREHCNAEWALKLKYDEIINLFESIDNDYLRTRKDDITDVCNRIIRNLQQQSLLQHETIGTDMKGMIIFAENLSPGDIILMKHNGIIAFATEHGGATSHTAILANSLELPAIVGLKQKQHLLKNRMSIILDGSEGTIFIEPDTKTIAKFQKKKKQENRYINSLKKLRTAVTKTHDGVTINLQANIESPETCHLAKSFYVNGVGLYRTEYMYMNRQTPPDEEEHFITYSYALDKLNGIPLTIRTFDMDTDTSLLQETHHTPSANPSLGLRGIRLCLAQPKLFIPQLRAILRVSAFGPVRLMLPMICQFREIEQVLQLIDDVQIDLKNKGIKYSQKIPIGAMIETPAAAVCADLFSKKLDFLSIGTNDLIQYTMAIDRENNEVDYLYNPLNLSVLRLINTVIKAAEKTNTPVCICGEMASNLHYTPLLLGMGLRDFSVHLAMLLEIRQTINKSDINSLSLLAKKALAAKDEQTLYSIFQKTLPPATG